MRPILLIGPREDSVLLHFANYARANNCNVYHCSDLSDIQFSIWMDSELGGNVQFFPSNNESSISQFSLFLHCAYELFPAVLESDRSFQMNEKFASLWSLCAINQFPVINRPGLLDWQFDKVWGKTSIKAHNIPNLHVSNSKGVVTAWNLRSSGKEVHIENRITSSRAMFTEGESLKQWLKEHVSGQYRMIFPTNSDYIVHLIIGNWTTLLLNETEYNPDLPDNKALLSEIHRELTKYGVSFYVVISTFVDGKLKILRIETDPPFEWYKDVEESVHFNLLQLLQDTQTKGGLSNDSFYGLVK